MEVVLATTVVLLDVLIPSLVLVLLAAISLAVRRQSPATLGVRPAHAHMLVPKMFALAVAWSLVQLSLTMPLANYLSGQNQDLSQFDDLQGNLPLLLVLLALSWTLAAFVEELAFRGFLLARVGEILGSSKIALVLAVFFTSLLFGVMHSEQGLIGVLLVTLDAIVLSIVRLYYHSLWASVLLHGFNNTLGFLTFFLVGPIYGFW